MSVPTLTPRAAREQGAFRALLNAMARPGLIANLGKAGEPDAALTILEALLDHEVTFAVVPDRSETVDAILRQTGSHNVPLPDADFVLTDTDALSGVLEQVKVGDLEYPDRSATVVCLVPGLSVDEESGLRLTLAGPGINGSRWISIEGISPATVEAIQETNGFPPQGVELVFVTPSGRFACITRYTRLTEVQ